MTKQRIEWADTMKAGSIMAVVLYHTGIQADVKSMAYLLCLPAFFFVSGLFASATSGFGTALKRSMRLMWPYLIFGVLSWVAWLAVGRRYGSDAGEAIAWWQPLWGLVVGRSEGIIQNAPLWFLPCLMVVEWLFYVVMRCPSRWTWVCTGLLSVAGYCMGQFLDWHLPWSMDTAMTILPLYVLGYATRRWLEAWNERHSVPQGIAVWVVAVLGVACVWYLNPGIKLSAGHYGHPVLFYAGELLVVLFWYMTALGIGRMPYLNRAMQWLGRQTLWILCLHLPLFGVIKGALLVVGVPLRFYTTNAGSLTLWAGSLVLSIPLILLINRLTIVLGARTPRVSPGA